MLKFQSVDDMKKIRLSQLRTLLANYPSQAALAERINQGLPPDEKQISATQISSAINGHRPIGEKLYRKIERGLGLEPFWFDAPGRVKMAPAYEDLPQAHQDIIQALSAINQEQQQLIWNLIHEFSKTSAPDVAKWLGKRDYVNQKRVESVIEKTQKKQRQTKATSE